MLFIWFIAGLFLGSFCGVVSYRLSLGQTKSILFGRSCCNHCHKTLAARDLIPLVSFVILRGRCRYCHKPIGWEHFLVELICGLALLGIGRYFGLTLNGVLNSIIVIGLIIVAGIDWKIQLINEKLIIVLALPVIIYSFIQAPILPHVYGLLIGGLLPAALVIMSRENWMGIGDIELGALLGLWLGYPLVFIALLLAFVIGAIYGIILIVTKKASMQSAVPFGPFLVTGAYLALLFGGIMLQWILGGQ